MTTAVRSARQDHRGAVPQQRQRLLHGEKHTFHIGAEGASVMLLRDRAERHELPIAGICKNDVDVCVLLLDGVVELVDVAEIGHVAAHAGYPAVDLFQRRVERVLPTAGDEHRCALASEGLGGGEADAARAAGYHDHLVVEPVRNRLLLRAYGVSPSPCRCLRNADADRSSIWHTAFYWRNADMRADLNDYAYFADVVAHGGFAAAARAQREPKSKLSRRIAGLEQRLGLRLIERSSRRFRVTDTGQAFYERCRAILAEAEQAEALVMQAQAEPYGRIRFSCPTGMIEPIAGLVFVLPCTVSKGAAAAYRD